MLVSPSHQPSAQQSRPDFERSGGEDPVFGPQTSYMFDEDMELHDLQQDISVPELKNHQDQLQLPNTRSNPLVAFTGDDTMNPMRAQYANDSAFQYGHAGTKPAMAHGDQSARQRRMQDQIISKRPTTVLEHFGQVTPPDDASEGGRSDGQEMGMVEPDSAGTLNAKSERARNAANQRHGRRFRPKKDSVSSEQSLSGNDNGNESDKREKYREKNRLAAAKCRAKKKVNTDDLESQARSLQTRNKQLKEEDLNLRDELSFLRNCALEHLAGGCQNDQLVMYNQMKADQAAKTAQMDLATSSPVQTYLSPLEASSRVKGSEAFSNFVGVGQSGPSSHERVFAGQGDFC